MDQMAGRPVSLCLAGIFCQETQCAGKQRGEGKELGSGRSTGIPRALPSARWHGRIRRGSMDLFSDEEMAESGRRIGVGIPHGLDGRAWARENAGQTTIYSLADCGTVSSGLCAGPCHTSPKLAPND